MNVFKLIMNAGVFIKFFKKIIWLIQYVALNKAMPPKMQISLAILAFEEILKSGAIDIPGLDENQIAEAVDKIRLELVGSDSNV